MSAVSEIEVVWMKDDYTPELKLCLAGDVDPEVSQARADELFPQYAPWADVMEGSVSECADTPGRFHYILDGTDRRPR